MDSVLDEPRLTPDKISVVFTMSSRGRTTECLISKRALVEYFWAPHPPASDYLSCYLILIDMVRGR
jgi:hypothetical protein